MKYKNLILFIIFFLFIEIANSADTLEVWCLWSSNISVYNKKCNDKSWFELYECRVINLCNSCNTPETRKLYETEDYEEAWAYLEKNSSSSNALKAFYDTKNIYTENMNSIYKCALIDIQERWIEYIQKIISTSDKTWLLQKSMQSKINEERTKILNKKREIRCWWLKSEATNNNKVILKKEVLDQVSFEYCKYNFYLDYLRSYYQNLNNLMWVDSEKSKNSKNYIEIHTINEYFAAAQNEIDKQNEKIDKVFPFAFYAYSDYEENFILHLLLNIIKSDYIIARDLLAQVLWPLNQVLYKVKDAMKVY